MPDHSRKKETQLKKPRTLMPLEEVKVLSSLARRIYLVSDHAVKEMERENIKVRHVEQAITDGYVFEASHKPFRDNLRVGLRATIRTKPNGEKKLFDCCLILEIKKKHNVLITVYKNDPEDNHDGPKPTGDSAWNGDLLAVARRIGALGASRADENTH
jgi:hypothetical protein